MLTEPAPSSGYQGLKVSDAEVMGLVETHCQSCHSANPSDAKIKLAPKGVMFASTDDLKRYAKQIEAQSVRNKVMPLGNKTGMTNDERQKLGAWLAAQ